MHKGISLQATYTYSHSIDDASSVGGSGGNTDRAERPEPRRRGEQLQLRPPPRAQRQLRHRAALRPQPRLLQQGQPDVEDPRWLQHLRDVYVRDGRLCHAASSSALASEVAAGAGNTLRPNRIAGPVDHGAGHAEAVVQHRRLRSDRAHQLRQRLAQLDRAARDGLDQRIALAHGVAGRNPQYRVPASPPTTR